MNSDVRPSRTEEGAVLEFPITPLARLLRWVTPLGANACAPSLLMAPIHKTAATASDRKLIVLSCCCDIVRVKKYFSASLLCVYSGSNNYVCVGVDMVSLSNNVELSMMLF
jgi:hypothetical protein